VSKREILSRVERVERAQELFQTEIRKATEDLGHELRKDFERLSTSVARLETKMDNLAQNRHDAPKWGDTVKTMASVIAAVGIVLGGLIWIIRAQTDMQAVHQDQHPQVVYVAPSSTPPAPPIQIK